MLLVAASAGVVSHRKTWIFGADGRTTDEVDTLIELWDCDRTLECLGLEALSKCFTDVLDVASLAS